MRYFIIAFLLVFSSVALGQTVGQFRYDTVKIYKVGGTTELILQNKTKDTSGFLFNLGNGLTEFRRPRQLNDSTLRIGIDTFILRAQGVLNNYPTSVSLSAGTLTINRNGLSAITTPVSTTNITEGTNLYYTNARARLALSSGNALLSYDNTTGVIGLNFTTADTARWGGSTGLVTSVSGTSNRITVTGTTTPVIDISGSYVGQSSITTLGTITTGVWNGTPIANANLANSTIGLNTPGFSGTAPNWTAVAVALGNNAVLNIPMASATGVTAGLISKTDYDAFTTGSTGFATIPSNTIVARTLPGTGVASAHTGTQITTLLSVFTSTDNGVVPNSNGCVGCYIDGDQVWKPLPIGGIDNGMDGSGFRPLNAGSQDLRTYFGSNTILLDSASNANGLTWKADTSQLATQYDLTLISGGSVTLTNNRIGGRYAGTTGAIQDVTMSSQFDLSNTGIFTIVDYVTPKMFGAVGDNSTNDNAAVQAAINSGKPVLIDTMYRVTGLTVPSGARIYGRNNNTCGFSTTTNAAVFTINVSASSIRFEGFKISGNTAGSSQAGIKIDGAANATSIKNVFVTGMHLTGLYTGLYATNNLGTNRDAGFIASNNFIQSCTGGIWTENSGEYNIFSNNRIVNCTTGFFNNAGSNAMFGGSIVGCGTGVYLGNGTNNAHSIISGVTINHSSSFSIHADGVLYGHVFANCIIYSGVSGGNILIEDSDGIKFEGGDISENDVTITNSDNTKITNVTFKSDFTATVTGSNVVWHANKYEGAAGMPAGVIDYGIDDVMAIRNTVNLGHSLINLTTASADAASYRNIVGANSSRGTHASPTALAANDQIFSLVANGYDGTNFVTKASMDLKVDNTVSSGVVPMSWSVSTSGTSGGRLERLKVGSNGNLTTPYIPRGATTTDSAIYLHPTTGVWEYRPVAGVGGGSSSLTQFQVGVGDASNLLSGSSAFTFTDGVSDITSSASPGFTLHSTGHTNVFGTNVALDIYGNVSSGVGAVMAGFSGTGLRPGFRMQGFVNGVTVSNGVITFEAYKSNGSGGSAVVGDAEAIFSIFNGVNFLSGTPTFMINGDGSTLLSGVTPFLTLNDPATSAVHVKAGIVEVTGQYYPGLWLNQTTPSVTNYSFLADGNNTLFNSPGGTIGFRISNAEKMGINANGAVSFNTAFGTSGQVLTSAGTGGPPTWTTISSGGENLQQTIDIGSTLTSDETIQVTGNRLTVEGNTTGGDATFEVNNTSSGAALFAHSATGTAVDAQSTSGSALNGLATSGFGVFATASTGIPGVFIGNPTSTNTRSVILDLYRNTSGTAANSISGSIQMNIENSDGTSRLAGILETTWTDVVAASRTSSLKFSTMNSAVETLGMTISGNGNVTVNTGMLIIATQFTPSSSSDATHPIHTLAVDDNFLYYKTGSTTWVRQAWSAF